MKLHEIIEQTNDYIAHYTTGGSIELEQKIRAINRAIEYVRARLGLLSDERVFTFNLWTEKHYYELPQDFREPIDLIFADEQKNTPENAFEYVPSSKLLKKLGFAPSVNQYSIVYFNRKKQLLVFSKERGFKQLIESFDGLTGLSAEEDLTNLAINSVNNAVTFDIIRETSSQDRGILKKTFVAPLNLSKQITSGNFVFRAKLFLTSSDFTSIDFRFGSSDSDYWQISTNQDMEGNSLTTRRWIDLMWDFKDAIMIGNPDPSTITFFRIIFNESTDFVNSTGFQIKDLFLEEPIAMNLIYYSLIKGTDVTGTIEKIYLDDLNDNVNFADFAPELINPIALKAATYLIPQLRKDPQFWGLYKAECEEVLRELGRSYPRKRAINYGQIKFKR